MSRQESPKSLSTVGPWAVDAFLGDGGQAYVYRVYRDNDAAKTLYVAKVLKPGSPKVIWRSEEHRRGRFLREVSALKTLSSTGCPNIVTVLDADLSPKSGKQPWYVMPYYEAGSMLSAPGKYAEQYGGNIDRVLEIAGCIANTLAWMHENEPPHVHRDVHVGNIFFSELGGTPILGDFGLVHSRDLEDDEMSQSIEPFGPARWRPPEFKPGSEHTHDPKSDVYLLGGVIYEAITRGEYIEETQRLDGSFTHESPSFPIGRFTNDEKVGQTERLLRHMLARDPSERMTARQVQDACDTIRAWKPGEAHYIIPPTAHLDAVAAKFRQRVKVDQKRSIRADLLSICDRVAARVDICYWADDYHFSRRVEANQADTAPFERAHAVSADATWAAVRVMVRFEPTPPILLMSYVMIGRAAGGQERLALFSEDGTWRDLSESFPGDPRHEDLLYDTAVAELQRLQERAAAQLEAAGP